MQTTIPKWLTMTLNLLLLYLLLAAGVTLGAWEYATWQSMRAIQNNPGFAQRLNEYAESGKARQTILNILTVVEPLAVGSRQAKEVGLEKVLSSLPDLPSVNVEGLVQSLDNFVTSGEKLKNQLDSLAQLNLSAMAVEQYVAAPTKDNQMLLYDSLVLHTENVGALITTVNSAHEMMDSIAASADVISGALEATKSEGNFFTRPLAGWMNQVFEPLHQGTSGFRDSLFVFHTDLAKDADSINIIVNSTKRAITIETMVAPGFMRPVVHGVTKHVAYLLGFALLYALLRLRIFPKIR